MTPYNNNTCIETSGLHCPLPIIYCKAALNKLNDHETLIIKATDIDIFREIGLLVKNMEHILLDNWVDNGVYFFKLEKVSAQNKPVTRHKYPFRFPDLTPVSLISLLALS